MRLNKLGIGTRQHILLREWNDKRRSLPDCHTLPKINFRTFSRISGLYDGESLMLDPNTLMPIAIVAHHLAGGKTLALLASQKSQHVFRAERRNRPTHQLWINGRQFLRRIKHNIAGPYYPKITVCIIIFAISLCMRI